MLFQKNKKKMKGAEVCYDVTFPIPRNPTLWTAGQRWLYAYSKQHEGVSMAHYQDWVVSGEAWLFSESGVVEHRHGAALRFGKHSGVVLGLLCLVVSFTQLKDEYDDWDKNPFERATAAASSQVIQGQIRGLACVFRVYPFQTERLKQLLSLDLVPGLNGLLGAHMRECMRLSK
jgi:hypothetical protein